MVHRALYPTGSASGSSGEVSYGSQSDPSLHEIPTSPSRELGCFSSHSAQSTTTSSSATHSTQPLTPSVSPKWGRTSSSSASASAQFHQQQQHHLQQQQQRSGVPSPSDLAKFQQQQHEKQYSFIALPGSHVKKRPRRRYDEIERLYECNWPGCSKSYGTLNHLNAHVHMLNERHKVSFWFYWLCMFV
jgi:hypothetical protein